MSLDVTVREEPTELYKILKIAGLVASGGEAKFVVSEGKVRVNGAVETQKRKKIMVGDLNEFGGETSRVRLKEG